MSPIKILRLNSGIKQIKLAKESGVPQSRISLIENGWSCPTKKEAKKIGTALIRLCKDAKKAEVQTL